MRNQLYANGIKLLATDGQIYIDGRYNIAGAKRVVIERNKTFAKNFPHKIADAFEFKGRVINL